LSDLSVRSRTVAEMMTHDELAALRELPAPTFTQREEIIDGERIMLPALPPDLVPWRTPDDPVCVHDPDEPRPLRGLLFNSTQTVALEDIRAWLDRVEQQIYRMAAG